MTPLNLQDDLVSELKTIFAPCLFKSPKGGVVHLNIYSQDIPINESEDEESDPVPYIIVRLSSGNDPGGESSFNTVELVLIIAAWDDTLDEQGYRDVLNIIQKIYERFQEKPCLNGRSVFTGEFNWTLQEDTYYPYYFGACSLSFHIAALRREDELA